MEQDDLTTYGGRLTHLFKLLEYSNATEFAKGIRLTQPENLLRIIRKPDSKPGTDLLEKIAAKHPNISVNWVLTGSGLIKIPQNSYIENSLSDGFRSRSAGEPLQEYLMRLKDVKLVPLLNVGTIKALISMNDLKEGEAVSHYVIPDFIAVDYLFRLTDDSMLPRYNKGDLVACELFDKNATVIPWGKKFLISSKRAGVFFRRVKPGKDANHFQLVSDNFEYDPIQMPLAEIEQMARVHGGVILE